MKRVKQKGDTKVYTRREGKLKRKSRRGNKGGKENEIKNDVNKWNK